MTVDTKKLRELEKASTPRDWEHCYYDGPGPKGWCVDRAPECDDAPLRPVMTEADAKLIAAMKNALPELLEIAEMFSAATDSHLHPSWETASREKLLEEFRFQGAVVRAFMDRQEDYVAEITRKTRSLEAATELAEEGWSYADDYFKEKWEYKERIEELKNSASPYHPPRDNHTTGDKPDTVTINFNGCDLETSSRRFSYEQICQIAKVDAKDHPTVVWNTRKYGSGSLLPGNAVDVIEGMVINCTRTEDA